MNNSVAQKKKTHKHLATSLMPVPQLVFIGCPESHVQAFKPGGIES